MNLRSVFVMPLMMGTIAAVIHGCIALAQGGPRVQWGGAVLTGAALLAFFGGLMRARRARTHSNLPGLVAAGIVGALGAVLGAVAIDSTVAPAAIAYAVGVGLVLTPLYVFWYSRLPRQHAAALDVGKSLPAFKLQQLDGTWIDSSALSDRPTLWMFYRGNWCPLCMAQIKEVAGLYRELAARGVRVALISNETDANTRDLAERFDVPFTYLRDPDLAVADQLGLRHAGAVPMGMESIAKVETADAYFPTVVISDAGGKIIYLDETDNYRVRPEPQEFLAALDRLGTVPAADVA